MALHQIESKILSVLSGRMSAQEVAEKSSLPLDSVLSFAESLKEKGLAALSHDYSKVEHKLTQDGTRFLTDGFPEQRVLHKAELGSPVSSLTPEEKSVGIPWAMKNNWVKVEGGSLKLCSKPDSYSLYDSLQNLAQRQQISSDDLATLVKRKLVLQSISKILYLERTSKPTEFSLKFQEEVSLGESINILTREMLLSGSWRNAHLREYDVHAPAEIPFAAKRHMVSRLKRKIRQIFTEMGFEEMQGPEVQSSFWNFDALFQPQDHPARDLADTFYLKGRSELPGDKKLIERIKRVHEKCWGGGWLEENASKSVLRTHTTAVSAAYLYNRCQDGSPKKYFSIGKVYRNEATDYKHLAEFFQVEGIVVWDGATFRDLLGCLKEFYKKLGFEKIRFQPSYFPYTEPSLEVSVYFDKKKQWLELGGAGIFRPEVSIPLCDRYPVLAWGLSLERPLMLLNDMDDIRAFYKSSLGWIRKSRLQAPSSENPATSGIGEIG